MILTQHRALGFCIFAFCIAFASMAPAQFYSSDFEADNGSWAGTNDWAWGKPLGADGSALGGTGGPEPNGGFSGDNTWGTVLGGLHSPSMTSSLTQTFDLTGQTDTTLTFQEWVDTGAPDFDMAEVLVNGTPLYMSDGDSTQAWRQATVDLSGFDGNSSVDIEFRFTATAAVDRVGWYVDDVSISTVPEPVSYIMLAIGSLFLFVNRRLKR